MVPHPIVVDFAVALLVTSFACDLLARVVEEGDLATVAWWTLIFGTLAAGFAVISGLTAAPEAAAGEVARTIAWHRNLAYVTLGCIAAAAVWRGACGGEIPRRWSGVYWLLTGTGTATLVVTAYFGGYLVYRLGVGVQVS